MCPGALAHRQWQSLRICILMQDDIENLDKEISDRHAAELAVLEKRLAAEADAPDDGTVKLAESLYDTKLTSSQDKVALTSAAIQHQCLAMSCTHVAVERMPGCQAMWPSQLPYN